MNFIKKYQKRPIEVEAVQISEDSVDQILKWSNFTNLRAVNYDPIEIIVTTPTGSFSLFKDDWVIKGVDGNFYGCPDDTFKKLYVVDSIDSDANVISW